MTDFSTLVPDRSVLTQGPNPEVQMVQLVNRTDTDWIGQYARIKYECKAGGHRIFVPYHAMCYWFGHPDAFDVPGDRLRQFRLEEFDRLKVLYGTYDDLEAFHEQKPQVELYSVETGERLITVKDDPEGRHLTPAVQSTTQQEALERAVRQMQEQVTRLNSELAVLKGEDESMTAADRIATDIAPHGPEEKGVVTQPPPNFQDIPIPGESGIPGDVPTAPPAVTDPDAVTEDLPQQPPVG